MSYERPTRTELRDRAVADLSSALGEQRAFVRRSVERALAVVVSGLADGLWDRLAWLHTQLLPDRCGEEFLSRWAAIYQVPRKESESLTDWRGRVLKRIGNPTRGGASGDWAFWALEVPGVSKAWEKPRQLGAGSVGVLFAALADDGTYDLSATSAARAKVQAVLDAHKPLGGCRPVAIVPGAKAIRVEVGLPTAIASDIALREAIRTALAQHFAQSAPGESVLLSQLRRVVGSVQGVTDHRVLAPTTDIPLSDCSLPVLGELTFRSFNRY